MRNDKKSSHYCQNSKSLNVAAGHGLTIAKYSRVSSGYCVPEHHGQICQNNIQVLQHVGGGCETGNNRIYGSTHGELFFLNSTSEDN